MSLPQPQKITEVRADSAYLRLDTAGNIYQIPDPKIGEEYIVLPRISGGRSEI